MSVAAVNQAPTVSPTAPRATPPAMPDRTGRRIVGAAAALVLALIALAMAGIQITPGQPPVQPPGVRIASQTVLARFPPVAVGGQQSFLAVEPGGGLAVSDRVHQALLRFGPDGRPLSTWGPRLSASVQIQEIGGVAVSTDQWYVLDRAEPAVLDLDAAGRVRQQISLKPYDPYGPNGLAVDPSGDLYIADTGRSRILIFAPDGQYLRSFGGDGHDLGQLKQPMALAFAPDGSLFVADWENARIERWQLSADASQWNASVAWPTGFRPWAVAVDAMGRVFVPDTDQNRVDVFTANGQPFAQLGGGGTQLDVTSPTQVAFSPDRSHLYVLGDDSIAQLDLANTPPPPAPRTLPFAPVVLVALLLGVAGGGLYAVRQRRRTGSRLRGYRPNGRARSTSTETAVSSAPCSASRAVVAAPPTVPGDQPTSPRWRPEPLGAPGSARVTASAAVAPPRSNGAAAAAARTLVSGVQPAPRASARPWLMLAIGLAITLVALGIRTYHLDQLPSGLHGDEAAAGLDAERILHDGNIGPYSPLTLGRPTLPLYLTAPSVALLGNTVVAIRIVEALAGTLTVFALFLILWRHAGLLAATFGAALLAGLGWHLHLSRTGFNGATWVLFAVLSVGALLEATTRGRDWRWWAGAGILSGLAIYTYQAEWLFLGVVGLFLAGYVCWTIWRGRQLAPLGGALLMLGLTLLVGLPMILFALDPTSGYFGYFGIVSVFDKPDWQTLAGPVAWLQYLADRYADFWVRGCCHAVVDGTDGTGVTPLIPLATLALALIGLGMGSWRRRGPLVWIGLLVLLLVPIGAVGTLDGPARRTFALTPFLALLAGLGLAELVGLVSARRLKMRAGAVLGGLAVVVVLGYQGVSDYFTRFPGTPGDRWVYVTSLTNAARYMAALPPDRYVYFAADRWSIHYETIRYLAPKLRGEDRLSPFGSQDLTVDPANGAAVFVLMDQYRARLDDLEGTYPGGTVTTVGPTGDPDFIAYSVPPAS